METFIKALNNPLKELKELGCEEIGFGIMKNKIQTDCFYVYNLKTPAAQILKQEALACGGDFGLPKDAIL